jgi:hypothetical protein
LAKEDNTENWQQFFQQRDQFQKMIDPEALERK